MVKVCEECGREFSATHRDARWCGNTCRERKRLRGIPKEYVQYPDRPCAVCDTSFTPRRGNQIFCSKKCKNLSMNRRYAPRMQTWRAANHDKLLNSKRRYNEHQRVAKKAVANKLHQAQDGRCYLCGVPLPTPGGKGGPCIDHDHSCCPQGFSCDICRRGLACQPCNLIIGKAADDPARLRRIADNLEKANALVRQREATAA